MKIQEIPTWEQIPPERIRATSGHSGEVLDVREIAKVPINLVSVGTDGTVATWNLQTGAGNEIASLGTPSQLAVFGESHALVGWTTGFSIRVKCVFGCSGEWSFDKLKSRTTSLAFHENDSTLLIGGADGRVYRWRFLAEQTAQTIAEREKDLERYVAHQTSVSAVSSLHTGRAFFSADWDGALYGWLAYTADDQGGDFDRNLFGGRFFGDIGTYIPAPRNADRGITALDVSPDGSKLAVGTEDGAVEIWEIRGFLLAARRPTHNGRVVSISLNHDGSQVISLGRDGQIVASQIVPDPMYRISTTALSAQAIPFVTQEMKSARRVVLLSSGNALFATSDGKLGELELPKQPQKPSLAKPSSTPSPAQSIDSDY